MTLRDAAGLSASTLRKDPIRTLLTILGLGVGVAAILTVLTLGGAGQAQVEAEIARMGVDKVWLTAMEESSLTAGDGAAVAAAVGAPVCAGAVTMAAVSRGGKALAAQVAGYDAFWPEVHMPVLTAGRMFTSREFARGAAVALVDEHMAESLGDVLGRRIRVGARFLRVVGVVKAMTAPTGTVVTPLTTFQDTFPAEVAELTISVPPGQSADAVAASAKAALAERGAYRAMSLQEEIDAARSVIRIFVMVLACVAAVCMLTGSIGVMNILLVSVRERRREIGLIKAIGGTACQVGLLFLLEAAGYALLGGLTGLLLGSGLIRIFGGWIGLNASLSANTAIPVVAAATLLGMAFGVLPALRAAAMEPVDALKSE